MSAVNSLIVRGVIRMHIVHVYIHVKPEHLDAFRTATIENARSSIQEPGTARFDFIQQKEDPTRCVLVEVYRSEEDNARHRETAHYARWREAVADMLIEPRTRDIFTNIYPDDAGWD
jgi:autoinducer 2-degrading protein